MLFHNPAYAHANTLTEACNFTTKIDINASEILNKNHNPQCQNVDNNQPIKWAHFQGLDIKNNIADPFEFRMSIHERSNQEIFFLYDNGEILKSPTSLRDARLYFSWGELAYKFPESNNIITDILIRSEYSQSSFAGAPSAHIILSSDGLNSDITALTAYIFMAGVIMVLLPLSIILCFVTKRKFLLAYSASLITVLISGIFWSGTINYFFPSIGVGTQKEVSGLAIAIYGICQIFLMMTTFEQENRHKKTEKILLSAGMISVLGQLSCIFFPSFQWYIINNVVLLSLATLVIGLYICAIASAMKGSMIARLYTIVWAMPFIVASFRIAWGLELITGYDQLILVSPLFMLFGEGVLGAFVIGWLVHKLRHERDIAIGRQAALITLSETDSLTGLLNRRAFLEKVIEGKHKKSLIIVDIDHFKAINDAYSHAVGDDTIQYVTQKIIEVSPNDALIGRLGGEEFAILTHNTQCTILAQSLCDAIAAPRGSDQPPVTISCGLTEGYISNEKDWRLLYIAADQALYTAKNNGRNQIYPKDENVRKTHAMKA